MKKSLLASLLLLAFASAANAATYHADHFTVTYDEEFWGTTVSGGSGGAFSFATLDELGLSLTSTGTRSLVMKEGTWNGNTGLTIVADAGYHIAGITSGATGAINATPGSGTGTEAFAQVATNAYWYSGATYIGSIDTLNQTYRGVYGTSGSNGSFDAHGSIVFAPALGEIRLDYYTQGNTGAKGLGSTGTAIQSSAYFNVVTAPIPEPESYALLLAGLGLMGTVARRRSRNAT